MTSKELIEKLELQPHPEGGFYKETYRCAEMMFTAEGETRSVSTAIYFLLEDKNRSAFHKIRSDELWFFHQGQTLEIVFITNGELKRIFLGNDLNTGEVPQARIPANTWFGSRVRDQKGHSLVSCTVAPGFDFEDFEMADRGKLTQEYPHLKDVIEEFT